MGFEFVEIEKMQIDHFLSFFLSGCLKLKDIIFLKVRRGLCLSQFQQLCSDNSVIYESRAVFSNHGFVKQRCSVKSFLGTPRLQCLVLFRMFRFRKRPLMFQWYRELKEVETHWSWVWTLSRLNAFFPENWNSLLLHHILKKFQILENNLKILQCFLKNPIVFSDIKKKQF